MILCCPYCGVTIPQVLKDGMAACIQCQRVFDSSLYNRLLSASWLLRKNSYHDINQLISDTKMPEHEAILVHSYIVDNGYSHEEFLQALKLLGLAKRNIDHSA